MELAEKTAGSNYTLNNGFLGGKCQFNCALYKNKIFYRAKNP